MRRLRQRERAMLRTQPGPVSSRRRRRKKPDARFPPIMWALVGLLLLGGVAIVWTMIRHDRQLALEQELDRTAVPQHLTAWDPAWPPLPTVAEPAPRSRDVVRAAYAFAARKADILQFVPCYCGCEREGHRSNLDCYIKEGTVRGVLEWDDHAFT